MGIAVGWTSAARPRKPNPRIASPPAVPTLKGARFVPSFPPPMSFNLDPMGLEKGKRLL